VIDGEPLPGPEAGGYRTASTRTCSLTSFSARSVLSALRRSPPSCAVFWAGCSAPAPPPAWSAPSPGSPGFSHPLWHLRRRRLLPHDVWRQHFSRESASLPQRPRRLWRRLVVRLLRRFMVPADRVQVRATADFRAGAAALAAAAPRGVGDGYQAQSASTWLSTAGGRGGPSLRRCWFLIEQAIKTGEATHSGQVRFVVEGALDGKPLFSNQSARERALDIFSHLRIWDTAHKHGVLIYLCSPTATSRSSLTAASMPKSARPVGKKSAPRWKTDFRAGNFAGGVIKGIQAVSRELATYFPRQGAGPNELPDTPVVM